jgi:hypothetical protein
MEKNPYHIVEVDGQEVDLRNPMLAAILGLVLPGLGHLYQRRRAKGSLFMVSILTVYFLGFVIGGSHVVYASWSLNDKRWQYICQVPVGVPAWPALLQTYHIKQFEANDGGMPRTKSAYQPLFGGLMAPPRRPVLLQPRPGIPDDLSDWNAATGSGYELGSWFCMIAGLLNILVIYDAFSGPIAIPISGRKPESPGPPEPTGPPAAPA